MGPAEGYPAGSVFIHARARSRAKPGRACAPATERLRYAPFCVHGVLVCNDLTSTAALDPSSLVSSRIWKQLATAGAER